MIRQRIAYACDEDAARTARVNSERSASVSVNSAFGRPVLATTSSYSYSTDFGRVTIAATAINLIRLDAYLTDQPIDRGHTGRLLRLHAALTN